MQDPATIRKGRKISTAPFVPFLIIHKFCGLTMVFFRNTLHILDPCHYFSCLMQPTLFLSNNHFFFSIKNVFLLWVEPHCFQIQFSHFTRRAVHCIILYLHNFFYHPSTGNRSGRHNLAQSLVLNLRKYYYILRLPIRLFFMAWISNSLFVYITNSNSSAKEKEKEFFASSVRLAPPLPPFIQYGSFFLVNLDRKLLQVKTYLSAIFDKAKHNFFFILSCNVSTFSFHIFRTDLYNVLFPKFWRKIYSNFRHLWIYINHFYITLLSIYYLHLFQTSLNLIQSFVSFMFLSVFVRFKKNAFYLLPMYLSLWWAIFYKKYY